MRRHHAATLLAGAHNMLHAASFTAYHDDY
jgi:hypothetical protein